MLEPKWDGYRFVAQVEGGSARCWTRHGTELTSRVGDLARELVALLPDGSIIGGQLVALASDPGGLPGQDFDRLSRTIFGRGDDRLWLVIFDAPQLAGEQLAARPWHERRSVLEATLAPVSPAASVSMVDVFEADPDVHARLLRLGFEGCPQAARRALPARPSITRLAQAQDELEQRGGG